MIITLEEADRKQQETSKQCDRDGERKETHANITATKKREKTCCCTFKHNTHTLQLQLRGITEVSVCLRAPDIQIGLLKLVDFFLLSACLWGMVCVCVCAY